MEEGGVGETMRDKGDQVEQNGLRGLCVCSCVGTEKDRSSFFYLSFLNSVNLNEVFPLCPGMLILSLFCFS